MSAEHYTAFIANNPDDMPPDRCGEVSVFADQFDVVGRRMTTGDPLVTLPIPADWLDVCDGNVVTAAGHRLGQAGWFSPGYYYEWDQSDTGRGRVQGWYCQVERGSVTAEIFTDYDEITAEWVGVCSAHGSFARFPEPDGDSAERRMIDVADAHRKEAHS